MYIPLLVIWVSGSRCPAITTNYLCLEGRRCHARQKKFLTALQIFLAPNLLSKVRSCVAQLNYRLHYRYSLHPICCQKCVVALHRAKQNSVMRKAPLTNSKLYLSLECGIYNARQKYPRRVVLNVRPFAGTFC